MWQEFHETIPLITPIGKLFLSNENGARKMATITISKNSTISDFSIREEVSVYDRLTKLARAAKKIYSSNGSHHNNLEVSTESVEAQLAKQKTKALRNILLHTGTFH